MKAKVMRFIDSYSRKTIYNYILSILLIFLSGCFYFPKEPEIPLSDLPKTTENAFQVTVVRKASLSIPVHYIYLDHVPIAKLEAGEYTTFQVNPGKHTLSVGYHIRDYVPMHLYGEFRPIYYKKSINFHCLNEQHYRFLIITKASMHAVDMVNISAISTWPQEIILEKYIFITPGINPHEK